MKDLVKSYISDETAVDAEVNKIFWVVAGIAVVVGIVWFGWNMISEQGDSASEKMDNSNRNPGSGREFNGGPFGN